ncbi:hypothetical protein C8R44DRAFT_412035 [Mycena epipterygia]|nr:hypothetical protein C8R44DRAFT_412035 [Mycena epipterygia]
MHGILSAQHLRLDRHFSFIRYLLATAAASSTAVLSLRPPSPPRSAAAPRRRPQPRSTSRPGAHDDRAAYPYDHRAPGGAGVIQVMHTDDATPKLIDRVRRRCFNCCRRIRARDGGVTLVPGKCWATTTASSSARTRAHAGAISPKPGSLASLTLHSRSTPRPSPLRPSVERQRELAPPLLLAPPPPTLRLRHSHIYSLRHGRTGAVVKAVAMCKWGGGGPDRDTCTR